MPIGFDPPTLRKISMIKIFLSVGGSKPMGNFFFDFLAISDNFKILKILEKIYVVHVSSICYNLFGFDPPTLRKISMTEIFLSVWGSKPMGNSFYFLAISDNFKFLKISEKIYVEHASSITYLFEGSQWSTCRKLEYSFKS